MSMQQSRGTLRQSARDGAAPLPHPGAGTRSKSIQHILFDASAATSARGAISRQWRKLNRTRVGRRQLRFAQRRATSSAVDHRALLSREEMLSIVCSTNLLTAASSRLLPLPPLGLQGNSAESIPDAP